MKWYSNCFDSLIHSTVPIEVVAIDNASGDETVPFIKENYPQIKLIEAGENLGFGKANNIGLRYAVEQNADYVLLLNQDAWVKPDAVEKLIAQMRRSDYGILSPLHFSGDEKTLDFGFARYLSAENIDYSQAEDKVYPIAFVNAAIWLLSRHCIDTVGGFAPIFPHYGEDFNYTNRCQFHQQKIGIYPLAIGIHDRKQKIAKKTSFQQIRRANFVDNLVVLTNINRSLCGAMFTFPFRSFGYNLKTVGVWKSILLLFCSKWDVLKSLPTVCKERKMMKKARRTFLE